MKLKNLWIQNYQKYHEQQIVFENEHEISELQKHIYGNMSIVLFSGENGSGKTAILSFIAKIFKFIQRFRERLDSDYSISYDIKINQVIHNVIIRKEKNNIYICIDEKWNYIQEYRKGSDKGYCVNSQICGVDQVTYDEIKLYLPPLVYVIGFDAAYKNLTYGTNYIGDRLVDYRDISADYSTTSRGNKNSLGIAYLFHVFSTNTQLRNTFKFWGLELSGFVDVCTNVEDEKDFRDRLENRKPILKEENYQWEETYIKGQEIYFNSEIENYLVEIDSEYNERFMIVDYLKNQTRYKTLVELINRRIIYINEFYIRRNGKEISIRDMSTGEKSFLFDLFSVCSKVTDNALIIWEEPETHLNMKWSKNLIPLLVELFNKDDVQWLFSSHSGYMIKNLFQNQILLLKDNNIRNPNFNTFLANDTEINMRLFEDDEINPFETAVLNQMKDASKSEKKEMMNILGESYIKYMLYKTWEN
ncbi:AAA family ATPase [Acetobacterium carbinolicum]|uniref:AAA family ATPase n=1 Tax=Acetobacterium carbinolicum TaxID=52690 RepID=UPI0039BFCD77